jgi:hypothetical protein
MFLDAHTLLGIEIAAAGAFAAEPPAELVDRKLELILLTRVAEFVSGSERADAPSQNGNSECHWRTPPSMQQADL